MHMESFLVMIVSRFYEQQSAVSKFESVFEQVDQNLFHSYVVPNQ